MIILALDFESTGLNRETDQPIEVGAVLFSTGQKRCLESAAMLVKPTIPITQEITDITHIHPAVVNKFGFDSKEVLLNLVEMINQADAVAGQNVVRFDKLLLEAWGKREEIQIPEKLWIDTRTDLPGVEPGRLTYMLADHGIINPFPHSALADAMGALLLIMKYDIEEVVKRAKSPTIVLVSKQERSENHLAKQRKFRWSPDYRLWYKIIKELDFEKETTNVPFPIALAPPTVLVEQLWHT